MQLRPSSIAAWWSSNATPTAPLKLHCTLGGASTQHRRVHEAPLQLRRVFIAAPAMLSAARRCSDSFKGNITGVAEPPLRHLPWSPSQHRATLHCSSRRNSWQAVGDVEATRDSWCPARRCCIAAPAASFATAFGGGACSVPRGGGKGRRRRSLRQRRRPALLRPRTRGRETLERETLIENRARGEGVESWRR